MHHPDHFLPYGRQAITEDDINAVVEVLRSPLLTQGPSVPAFEQALATKVGAAHGVAVNSNQCSSSCLLGIGVESWRSALDLPDHLRCFGQLWSLLRC